MNTIDWKINFECNDNCLYCFGSKSLQFSKDVDELIIDRIVASNVENISITGGEPTINPERLVYIINRLSDAQKKIYLSTNGFRFFEVYESVKNKLDIIGVPLDGYDSYSNMINGRKKEAFENSVNIIKNVDENIIIKVGTVVTKRNFDYMWLNKIAEVLNEYNNVLIWRIYEIVPENRGAENGKFLLLNDEERNILNTNVQKISSQKHKYQIEFVTREMRSKNYLIIQPDGTYMIPIDFGDKVEEVVIGDAKLESIEEMENKWTKYIKTTLSEYYKIRSKDFFIKE